MECTYTTRSDRVARALDAADLLSGFLLPTSAGHQEAVRAVGRHVPWAALPPGTSARSIEGPTWRNCSIPPAQGNYGFHASPTTCAFRSTVPSGDGTDRHDRARGMTIPVFASEALRRGAPGRGQAVLRRRGAAISVEVERAVVRCPNQRGAGATASVRIILRPTYSRESLVGARNPGCGVDRR